MIKESFSRGASPFMRWSLTPFLLLFGVVLSFQFPETLEGQGYNGTIVLASVILVCILGLLALWGVPYVGRIISAIVTISYSYYIVMMIQDYDGDFGFGGKRSDQSLFNSIMGFLVFGLPCLFYTIFGRFSFRKELVHIDEHEDNFSTKLNEIDKMANKSQ